MRVRRCLLCSITLTPKSCGFSFFAFGAILLVLQLAFVLPGFNSWGLVIQNMDDDFGFLMWLALEGDDPPDAQTIDFGWSRVEPVSIEIILDKAIISEHVHRSNRVIAVSRRMIMRSKHLLEKSRKQIQSNFS